MKLGVFKMKIKVFSRSVIFALVFLVAIIGVTLILYRTSPEPVTGAAVLDEKAVLAQCLTQKGVSMGGAEWCGHCKNQKEMFGDSFEYIDYHDCDQDKTWCDANGITGYPTWIINGQKYPGEKTLEQLKDLAAC